MVLLTGVCGRFLQEPKVKFHDRPSGVVVQVVVGLRECTTKRVHQ